MNFEPFHRKPGGAILLALTVAVVAGSCKDSTGPELPHGVSIVFDHEVSGLPLTLHSVRYQNAAGNDYNINELKYYISDLQLVRSDGAIIAGPEVFYREDGVNPNSVFFFTPAGDYTALRFRFGVDAAHNHLNGLSDAVENLRMQWPDPFGGGYHYMQLDGAYATAAGDNTWLAHMGRLQRATDPAPFDPGFDVELPLVLHVQSKVTGRQDLGHHVHVVMDVNAWFATPSQYDFDTLGGQAEMSDPVALRALHDNGAQVFHLGTVN